MATRLLPYPSSTMLAAGTSVGLEELAIKFKELAGVSASPIVKATATGVSSSVTWLATLEIVGRSFTEVTFNTKLALEVVAPSLTVSVIKALPNWLAAGVMVAVRLAPLPPKTILANGTKVVFALAALSAKLLSAVST